VAQKRSRSSADVSLLIVEYFGDLVQMGIDIVGEPFELTPAFAKFCRLVRGWRAIKRARSVMIANASACFSGSASMMVI
jgi:hypothetical protein